MSLSLGQIKGFAQKTVNKKTVRAKALKDKRRLIFFSIKKE